MYRNLIPKALTVDRLDGIESAARERPYGAYVKMAPEDVLALVQMARPQARSQNRYWTQGIYSAVDGTLSVEYQIVSQRDLEKLHEEVAVAQKKAQALQERCDSTETLNQALRDQIAQATSHATSCRIAKDDAERALADRTEEVQRANQRAQFAIESHGNVCRLVEETTGMDPRLPGWREHVAGAQGKATRLVATLKELLK